MRCDAEQFLTECGGRWPPLLKWGAGGQIYLLSLCGCLWNCQITKLCWVIVERSHIFKKSRWKGSFFLLRLIAHAGFTSRSFQIMIFRGACDSVRLVCHRNMYHTGHWSKLKISSWLFKIPTEIKCLRYHIISRYDSFQKPYFRGVVFRFNREPS